MQSHKPPIIIKYGERKSSPRITIVDMHLCVRRAFRCRCQPDSRLPQSAGTASSAEAPSHCLLCAIVRNYLSLGLFSLHLYYGRNVVLLHIRPVGIVLLLWSKLLFWIVMGVYRPLKSKSSPETSTRTHRPQQANAARDERSMNSHSIEMESPLSTISKWASERATTAQAAAAAKYRKHLSDCCLLSLVFHAQIHFAGYRRLSLPIWSLLMGSACVRTNFVAISNVIAATDPIEWPNRCLMECTVDAGRAQKASSKYSRHVKH